MIQCNLPTAICGLAFAAGYISYHKLRPLLLAQDQNSTLTMVNDLSHICLGNSLFRDSRYQRKYCKAIVLYATSATPLLMAISSLFRLGLLNSRDAQKELFMSCMGLMGVAILARKLTRQNKNSIEENSSGTDIPTRWQSDNFLQHFLCTINSTPIRKIVKDPKANGLYDKKVLLKWLDLNPTSPLTRERMSWLNTVTNHLDSVQPLIDYRIQQLQKYEEELGRQLREEDKEWVKTTALDLESEIVALCTTPLDQINRLPQFLACHPSIHNCSITGQPIRHVIRPRWPETMNWNEKTMPLLDILYEEEVLKEHALKHGNHPPAKWPGEQLPWKIENITWDKERQRDLEQKILPQIVQELRQHCSFVLTI